MFKRFLAFGMAAMLFLCDVPVTAYAQTANADVNAVTTMAEAPLEVNMAEAADAGEAVDVAEVVTDAVDAETQPEAVEAAEAQSQEVATEEPVNEVIEEVTGEEPDAVQVDETTYSSIVVNTPTSAFVSADVKLAGYGENDYVSSSVRRLYMYLTDAEGNVSYDTPTYEWDAEEQAWFLRYDYIATENTTYTVEFKNSDVQYGETSTITTLAKPEVTYKVETNITGNYVVANVIPEGYANVREASAYLHNDYQSFVVSATEDFASTLYLNGYSSIIVEEDNLVKWQHSFGLEHEKTYYLKFREYDYTNYEYVDISEAIAITTEATPELTYTYDVTAIGKKLDVKLVIDGYRTAEEYEAYNNVYRMRYSTVEDFSSSNNASFTEECVEKEEGDGILVNISFTINNLEYATDYYIAPYVITDNVNRNYVTLTDNKVKATTPEKVEATYDMSYEMTGKLSINYSLKINGYASDEEYQATEPLSYYMLSTNADMSEATTGYLSSYNKQVNELDNGKAQIVYTGSITSGLAYSTTYYLAGAVYGYNADTGRYGYQPVGTPVSFTTEAAPELTYEYVTETVGRQATVGVKIYGYEDSNEYYSYRRIQRFEYATSESMENANTIYPNYRWVDNGDGKPYEYVYVTLSNLEYATDYYVVPVYYDDNYEYANATDIKKVTSAEKVEATYKMSYEVKGKTISVAMEVDGYEDSAEYSACDPINYFIASTTAENTFEDSSTYKRVYTNSYSRTREDGSTCMYVYADITGLEYDTTYYIAPYWNNSFTNNSYVAVTEVQEVKTMTEPVLSYDFKVTPCSGSVDVSYDISGYRTSSEYNQNLYIGYSTNEDFSEIQTTYCSSRWSMEEGEETGTYSLYSTISGLEYEKDYYVAMVTYDYEQGGYVAVTDVQKVTTLKKPEPVYNVTAEAQNRNGVKASVSITGYSSYNEYRNIQQISYLAISEKADMTEYNTSYASTTYKELENGGVEVIVSANFSNLKYSTTYYVAPMFYGYIEETNSYGYMAVATPVAVTTEANKALDCELTCEAPAYNLIAPVLTVKGYENSNEYWNSEGIYLLISETENFETYNTLSNANYATVNGEFIVTLKPFFLGKTNTDYYIKAARRYTYSETGWEDLTAASKITTKGQIPLTATMKADETGVCYTKFSYELSGVEATLIDDIVRLQISTDKKFENTQNSLWLNSNVQEGDSSLKGSVRCTGLSAETTYYARLVFDGAEGYIPVNDQVITFTTEADETFEDSAFPDEVFRNYVKSAAGISTDAKLTKAKLENITYLNISRSNVSNPVVKDITGIELMPCLSEFTANYHEISDISPLAKATGLRYINLEYNTIKTIPNLTALTELYNLNLGYNFIPESEFATAATKVSAIVATEEWGKGMADRQRKSDKAEIVLADTYYQTMTDVYPIQVEIGNIYPISKYTLSIYEGETLLQENLATTYTESYYAVVGWVVQEFATEAGTRELTFVVSKDGEEHVRQTKKIVFDENTLYNNGNKYLSAGESSYSVQAYIYGDVDEVTDVTLRDDAGTVIARAQEFNAYNYTNSSDYRYNDIFKRNNIRVAQYCNVSGTAYFRKDSVSGVYDLCVTMKSGETYTVEDAVTVTAEPVLNSMGLNSGYENNGESGEVYASVSGFNMPWDKISPTLYDVAGNAVTKVVEYKLTGTNNAVYKLEMLEGKEFVSGIEMKLVAQEGITIHQNKSQNVSPYTYPRIYYIEHIPSTEQVKVLTENIAENVEYTWRLCTSSNANSEVASCAAAVKDGQVILEFKDANGNKYNLQPDVWSYYVVAEVNYADPEITNTYSFSRNFNNYNYVGSSSSSNYSESVSTSIVYVNNGEAIEEGYYGRLRNDLLTEETEIVVKLYEFDSEKWQNGDEVEGTVAVVQRQFTNSADNMKYWGLTLKVRDAAFEDGKTYRAVATVDDKTIGTFTIYVIDDEKPAYSYRTMWSYNQSTNQMTFDVRGYWPENMDESKLSVRLTDAIGSVLFEGTPAAVRRRENTNESITYSYRYLDVSLGDKLTDIQSYTRIYYEVLYDGEPIPYQQGKGSPAYFSIGNSSEAWFMSSYPDGKYQQYFYYGVRVGMPQKTYCVKIYRPYETEELKKIDLTPGATEYKFTEADLAGLKYNDALERYDILLMNGDGKLISWTTGYLQAEAAKQEAQSVSLNKTATSIEVGASETLTATVTPAMAIDTSVTYSSSNPAVATVDGNGKVTAVGVGTAVITVSTVNGKSASCTVTVIAKKVYPTEITLSKTEMSLVEGKTETLRVTFTPADTNVKDVTFTVNDNNVASVDASGTVTAKKVGTAIITVKTVNGLTATCTLTVLPVEATGIELSTTTLGMVKGNTATLTATVLPENTTDKSVIFESSDTAVVTVDANGVLTAVELGTATITAKTANGVEATCTVEVVAEAIQPTKISLNKAEMSLKEGASEALKVTFEPANATERTLTFVSSDEAVATVDANGVVTAVKPGSVVITVTTTNDIAVTCNVTVQKAAKLLDVEEGWKLTAAQFVFDKGLMNGVDTDENGDVYFSPDTQLKREMLAQILYAAEGKQDIPTDKSFTDVDVTDPTAWYAKAVLWAAENGIVSGIGEGKFGVDQNITREQLALMLYQYAKLKGYDVSKTMELNDFVDTADVHNWSETAMKWAVANGVMSGKPVAEGTALAPQGEATRVECAAMLRSFMNNVAQ